MEDKKIIELFFSRSEQALAETETKYGRLCSNIAYGLLANTEDAEECVSTSYMKLWNAIPPKRPESLCGYLCTIVRNTALTVYDKLRRRSYEEQYDELAEIIPDDATVESRFDSSQLGGWINEFLAKTSKKSREVFVSRYYFNMSVAERAKGLGMSESAVKTRLARTRAALREFLHERSVEV